MNLFNNGNILSPKSGMEFKYDSLEVTTPSLLSVRSEWGQTLRETQASTQKNIRHVRCGEMAILDHEG